MELLAISLGIGLLFAAVLVGIFWLRNRAQQWPEVVAWIDICVAAAEQHLSDAGGGDKLSYVLTQVKLRFPGLKVDDRVIRAVVEAAVYRIKQWRTAPPPDVPLLPMPDVQLMPKDSSTA